MEQRKRRKFSTGIETVFDQNSKQPCALVAVWSHSHTLNSASDYFLD